MIFIKLFWDLEIKYKNQYSIFKLESFKKIETFLLEKVYDAWELHQALPLEGSREACNPHQAVYLIVVV